MSKKAVVFGSLFSFLLVNSALAEAPGFQSGFLVGGDAGGSCGTGTFNKKRFNRTDSPFDNRLKRDFNVIPGFSFGKVIYDQFHIALGMGLGITRLKHRVDNVEASVSVSSSRTALGFVPSVGAEYAYTKHISFIGNVSYEMYRKANSNFGQNVAPDLRGSGYWSAIKPKFLTPKAGIIYRF